jgi:prepilin-type N-terminal cleavage/methylation domain-containing protein
MKKLKGFTLPELLVVMAIIAFLTVGSFAGLTFGLRQARDTQRRTLTSSINTALLAYYADYQQYPGAQPTTPNIGCTGSGILSGSFTYVRCTNAMTATGGVLFTKGPNGLADYFEGTFNWGPIDPNANPALVGYYAGTAGGTNTRALKYGVCVVLENPNGGNIARPPAAGGASVGKKDCFCLGSDYTPYACVGLGSLQQ